MKKPGIWSCTFYNKLRLANKTHRSFLMKPDPLKMKHALRKREIVLQQIIRQMKQDELHSSPVYRNLEQELESLKTQLTDNQKEE